MSSTIEFEKIKCVIFDFDGVILDSSGLKTECFKKLYRQYEDIYDGAMQYHFDNKGMSRFRQFDYVTRNLMHVSDPESQAEKMSENFAAIVFDEVSKASFINGAKELIEFLYPLVPLYIVSSGPHDELEKIMTSRGLTNYFKAYYGSVDYKEEYIAKIIQKEALDFNEALYVGDTLKDLDAADKAGVPFCGVQNTLTDFSSRDCLSISDLFKLKMRMEKTRDVIKGL